jgi:protein-tyrosine phosphatase
MNILFVCSKNQWRSRTAETIFKNNGQHQVRSAGTSASARIRLDQAMIKWADIIFVMEHQHKERILSLFQVEGQTLIVLDIPDEYIYMDEELIEMLREGTRAYW